jgi:hypothetical protein
MCAGAGAELCCSVWRVLCGQSVGSQVLHGAPCVGLALQDASSSSSSSSSTATTTTTTTTILPCCHPCPLRHLTALNPWMLLEPSAQHSYLPTRQAIH